MFENRVLRIFGAKSDIIQDDGEKWAKKSFIISTIQQTSLKL
jgi:hypothetical protein